MATDIATLGLKLDGDGLVTGTDKAAVAVKRLGQEGDRTEQQVGKLDLTLKRAAGSTQAFEAAQKRATAVARQQAASDRGIRTMLEARRQRDIVESAASGAATAKAFTDAQEREFRFQMAALKEESARGLITPTEAARRGRDAATAYNQAILSRISTVGGAGGFEGGGRERFAALAGSLKNVDVAGRSAAGGVGRLNLTLASLLSQATQTHPAVGQLTQVVGSLAIGSGLMLGVLGGLAALGLAYRELTKDSRELKEAHDRSIESLRELVRLREISALGPGGQTNRDVLAAGADISGIGAELNALLLVRQQLVELEALGLGEEGAVEASERREAVLREELATAQELWREGQRTINEALEEREEERTTIAKREADERASIAEREAAELRRIEEERQRPIDVSQGVADNLIIQIDAQERLLAAQKEGEEAVRLVTAALAREQAFRVALVNSTTEQAAEITRLVGEYHDLIDALADEKRAVEQGEAAYKRFLEIIAQGNKDREAAERARLKAIEDEVRAEKERTRTIREQIRQGEEYATSVIQVANAFGFLDDEAARSLESVVQIGAAIARIAILKDPTAIPSLIGGIASLIAGGGPTKAELRAERLQEENNRILEQNTRSLERLREANRPAVSVADAEDAARAFDLPGFGNDAQRRFGATTVEEKLAMVGLSLFEFARIAQAAGVEILDANGNVLRGTLDLAQEAIDLMIEEKKRIEAAFKQNLDVRLLVAQGKDKEAEDLRLQIQQEKELADARKAGFDEDTTIKRLKEVQALERLTQARRDELRVIEQLQAFQRSLNLGPLSTLSPSAQFDEARRIFEETRTSALGGDAEAALRLPQEARAFLNASRAFNASGPGFASDFAAVQAANDAAIDLFGEQLAVNDRILQEAKRQTGELKIVVLELIENNRISREGFLALLDRADVTDARLESIDEGIARGGEVLELAS